MFGLDDWIAALGAGHPLLMATVVAILLGLRHATDPDHLSAVTTLIAAEPDRRRHVAMRMGFAWGLGHATTLFIFGMPIIFYAKYLPTRVEQLAEAAIGLLIIGLAARLIVRWRRGQLHVHEHEHGGRQHSHIHGHTRERADSHAARPVRSPLAAYGIGLVHGLGGSAGVGLLLLASIPSRAVAIVALILFAGCTAVSMALCSGAFGIALSGRSAQRAFDRLAPALGVASFAFGLWYLTGALTPSPF